MKIQKRTAAFIRFKEKHTALSELYWGIHFALDATASALKLETDKKKQLIDVIPPSFDKKRLDMTIEESETIFPEYMVRLRVFSLLGAAANLEAYLKEIMLSHLLSKGFGELPEKLSTAGKALSAPILDSNSLMSQLKFARDYFDVDITREFSKWDIYYKIRSNMAHAGGFATARTLRELPNHGLIVGDLVEVTWEDLKEALRAVFDMADKIDRKAFTQEVWDVEVYREAHILKEQKLLQKKYTDFKIHLHRNYGISRISRPIQNKIKFSFFSIT